MLERLARRAETSKIMRTARLPKRKLTRETMLNFGFIEKWPGGNPKEPWWYGHPAMPDIWFPKLPTVEQFWKTVSKHFYSLGKEDTQSAIREALGM